METTRHEQMLLTTYTATPWSEKVLGGTHGLPCVRTGSTPCITNGPDAPIDSQHPSLSLWEMAQAGREL